MRAADDLGLRSFDPVLPREAALWRFRELAVPASCGRPFLMGMVRAGFCWGSGLLVLGFAVGGCLPCRQPAGIPPRRAGHFHLLAQMKVTKAKGLEDQL